MNGFKNVLCFCPASRLSLASQVLATWSEVRSFVLVDETRMTDKIAEFDAAIVMDGFVTRDLVEQLSTRVPVIVLAWNGLFEIVQYRERLRGLDVTFMGTDESLDDDTVPYIPLINGDCAYAEWRRLYERKPQFTAAGSPSYRLRWMRARAQPVHLLGVLMSAAGALQRPRALRATLASTQITDKLVWAGNCLLDPAALRLSETDAAFLRGAIDDVMARSRPSERLAATVALAEECERREIGVESQSKHRTLYITNTLLRWSVLAFLQSTSKDATWFFGRDNLGLGLEMELYVHNLVPRKRVAFLELGGKTAANALYPRALYLLARQYYVISVPSSARDAAPFVERLAQLIATPANQLFAKLDERRLAIYRSFGRDTRLRDAQQRVWSDFALFAQTQREATGAPSAARSRSPDTSATKSASGGEPSASRRGSSSESGGQ